MVHPLQRNESPVILSGWKPVTAVAETAVSAAAGGEQHFASSSPRLLGVAAASAAETEGSRRFLSLPFSQNQAGTLLVGFVFSPGTFLWPPEARSRRTLLAAPRRTSLPAGRGATAKEFRTQARRCCRHFEGRADAFPPGWGPWV